LRSTHVRVFVSLPSLAQRDAVRTAQRWLDGLLVLVPSGTISGPDLAAVREALGIPGSGLGLVLVSDSFSTGSSPVGDPARVWRPATSPERVARNSATRKRARRTKQRPEEDTPSDVHALEEFEESEAPNGDRSQRPRERTGH
jgi:hypothetical protein